MIKPKQKYLHIYSKIVSLSDMTISDTHVESPNEKMHVPYNTLNALQHKLHCHRKVQDIHILMDEHGYELVSCNIIPKIITKQSHTTSFYTPVVSSIEFEYQLFAIYKEKR